MSGEAEEASDRRALREQLRCHRNAMEGELTRERIRKHYEALSKEEKEQDRQFFNRLLKLIRTLDGLRVESEIRFDRDSLPC